MRRVVTVPQAPEVQLLGDAALTRGASAIDAYRLLARGVETARRQDGIEPSPRVDLLLAAFKVAADLAMSANSGHDRVRNNAVSQGLVARPGTRIRTKEAAEMLGLCDRQVRRLGPKLGGRRTGKNWTFEKAAVEAFLVSRHSTKETS